MPGAQQVGGGEGDRPCSFLKFEKKSVLIFEKNAQIVSIIYVLNFLFKMLF